MEAIWWLQVFLKSEMEQDRKYQSVLYVGKLSTSTPWHFSLIIYLHFNMWIEVKKLISPDFRVVGFPGRSEVKVSACNAGDLGSIPGLGRSPGEGNGNPFQYSCLENPMDRGAWWPTTVHGVAKSRTRLSDFTFTFRVVVQGKWS